MTLPSYGGRRSFVLPLLALSWACSDSDARPVPASHLPAVDASQGAPDAALVPQGTDAAAQRDAAAEPPESDESARLFDPGRVLEVAITLAPADFAKLRSEGRSLVAVLSGCEQVGAFAYSEFHAQLRVDGHELSDVRVRKKGLLGSISVERPSLRVDLDGYVDGQELFDERTLTLNNSLQDRTYSHQCIAYALFEKAGIPAPRCNFAHVTVNGEDLGSYVHVEAIKKPFLKRRFGDDDGDLYEGTAADFTVGRIANLEKKTREDEPLSPEISALIEALQAPDAELEARLARLLDLDAFFRFWASEVLMAESDGYAGNQNNYFLYVHPDTRKLHFIPWGTDGALSAPSTVTGAPEFVSVYAKGALARRLYGHAPTRDRYRATLRALLEGVWSEAELHAELTRITTLVGAQGNTEAIDAQKAFFDGRRAALLAELDAPAPALPAPVVEVPLVCHEDWVRPIQGTFDLPLGTAAEPGVNLPLGSSLTAELASGPVLPLIAAGFGGVSQSGTAFGLLITELDGSVVQLLLISQRARLAPGVVPFHGFETFGLVLTGPDADHLKVEGFIGDGALHIDELVRGQGSKIRGRFEGKLALIPPA